MVSSYSAPLVCDLGMFTWRAIRSFLAHIILLTSLLSSLTATCKGLGMLLSSRKTSVLTFTFSDSYEARMLILRTPPSLIKASTVLQDCLTLLRAVWEKEYTVTHEILQHSSWPDVLKPLVQAYQSRLAHLSILEPYP